MNYAKEGDKILDTHLGSGSIAIACHNLGFNLVACELDTEYYNNALK
jgi:site-specific DNA-methyltransferase (adenine-specific)